jgi:hypothetical protein
MKTQIRILIAIVLAIAILPGCSKNDNSAVKPDLKQAFNQGAQDLNRAMDDITASKAFGIFTLGEGLLKSGTTDPEYEVYISLDQIKGIFDYKPVPKVDRKGRSIIQFFDQTADDNLMVVNMPLSKVLNPRSLRKYSPEDALLPNNFTIAVSDYHNNYNSFRDYDYALQSEISIDEEVAGKLDIASLVSPEEGITYASQYAFTGSYTAKYKYETGDISTWSFTINSGDDILYEEKRVTVKVDDSRFGREHEYTLTIGDVSIVRKSKDKTVEVYVDGILQPGATVKIVDREDGDDDEISVCKKRDVQITFEDGTTTTVSELIGESIDNIKTLFTSLRKVYFAAYVVDWIAYDIYYQRF